MRRSRLYGLGIWMVLLMFTPHANALPFGDLNGDGTVNVADVQLMIVMSLGLPLSPALDADGNGVPDEYEANSEQAVCGANTEKDGLECIVDQAWLDDLLAASFDEGFAACEALNCDPDCSAKECGDDGCGGDCGTCDANSVCTSEGVCECVPDCSNVTCGGSDGCTGTCGVLDACPECATGTTAHAPVVRTRMPAMAVRMW